MFRNFFTTAWRNLIKNKAYSALNILGLAIGMAVALLIGLWVQYQNSYDRDLPGYQQVYQARLRFIRNGERQQMMATPLPLSEAMRKEVPGVRYAAHTDWMGYHNLAVGDKKLFIGGAQAEEDFFHIFPYPALKGDPSLALKDPYSIVLTESTAHSLFGNDDPMNKTLRVDNRQDLVVKAVIRDLPGNSTFNFNYVIPFSYSIGANAWVKEATTNWHNNSFQTFVALQPHTSYEEIEPKLKALVQKYDPESYTVAREEVFMQPMKDWHLFSEFKNGEASGGFIEYVRLFSLIGVLVLLIACINFMNLSTARSEKRAREVGVRKALGSLRGNLILQFLVESLVITFVAAAVSLLLVQLILPAFNTLTNCHILVPYSSFFFWVLMAGYVMGTGLLAGSRPAFYLSSFRPVKVLKGSIRAGRTATLPRKLLVVLQFTCSIALIISTLLIYQQIQYAKDRPSGYDNHRLVLADGSEDLRRNYTALKNELLQTHLVESVTLSSSPVTALWNWSAVQEWSGKYPRETLSMASVDIAGDYFKTLGMQLVAGKNFTGNVAVDSGSVIINEAAALRMRLKDPINQSVTWRQTHHVKIIGVVKDALMLSPFNAPEPTFFAYNPDEAFNVMYRISRNADLHTAMDRITAIFNKYNPAYPFSYHFADESYADKFRLEVLVGRLAGLFAVLAIFISCLGLFGLAAYMAEQRTREIGIRKVLGATVSQLWLLLSKDFIVLVIISCVVASPIAYYSLHSWLEKYTYRITIGPGVFFLAAILALAITVLTISWQAIRGAMANPANSLRSE